MPINAHKAISAQPEGYKQALNLTDEQREELRSVRDEIRSAISAAFSNTARAFGEAVIFADAAPSELRSFSSPKFRMQGSFSYHTCNRPAHVPPQEIDLDDGMFLPVSFFQSVGGGTPVMRSQAYFAVVERILLPLCQKNGWQLVTDKASCVRVKINKQMHADVALYAVPDADFQRILKEAAKHDRSFADSMIFEDTIYRNLSRDEMMLAHREEGWKKSDPRKLEDWFLDAVKEYGEQVRFVCRYLKGWKDYQWENGRLASIALMAAVVSVYEEASAQITDNRDDLALLQVSERLPEILSNEIPNPVVEGARLDEGWKPEERRDFVAKAIQFSEGLRIALVDTTDRAASMNALKKLFGERIPSDLALYITDAGLETKAAGLAAPAALSLGMINNIEDDPDSRAAVDKRGDGRYG